MSIDSIIASQQPKPKLPEVQATGSLLSGDPYTEWSKNKTPAAMSAVVTHLKPQIDSAMRSYGGGKPNPMLASEARLLAAKAVQSYDPASKASLQTHTAHTLKELRRRHENLNRSVKAPERLLIANQQIGNYIQSFEVENNREPTLGELADRTGIPEKRIERIMSYKPGIAEGQILAAAEEEDSGGGGLPGVSQGSRSSDQWLEFVYDDMTTQQQLILDLSLGLHGKRKVSDSREIAKRAGVSPGRVSQVRKEIQEILDNQPESDLF